jgi:hypothetical protein
MKVRVVLVSLGLTLGLSFGGGFEMAMGDTEATSGSAQASDLDYEVMGADARLVRDIGGEISDSVEGVPASPVHAFDWDGDSVEVIEGELKAEIDPVANMGQIKAQWSDRNGAWTLTQTMFEPPDHPSGVRLGPSVNQTMIVSGDPVTTNIYLHGDTTAGGPVLPTLFNSLATWGPARVTLNGQPFENPFDGPAPMWATHMMVTYGVRLDDGSVTANGGQDIYNPQLSGAGDTQPDDREVHLVFHDAPGPTVEGNFPPDFSFFYHLQFEDVEVEIQHAE